MEGSQVVRGWYVLPMRVRLAALAGVLLLVGAWWIWYDRLTVIVENRGDLPLVGVVLEEGGRRYDLGNLERGATQSIAFSSKGGQTLTIDFAQVRGPRVRESVDYLGPGRRGKLYISIDASGMVTSRFGG